MEEIGRDRSVYAPDLPGCGESDPTPPKPSIEDYAAALADFLDHMRFRQIDVLGHHTGCADCGGARDRAAAKSCAG